MIAGLAAYMAREPVGSWLQRRGGLFSTGPRLDDYAGVWVLEAKKDDPRATDVCVFAVQSGSLIGTSPGAPTARLVVKPAADGRLTGTATVDGETSPIDAVLSVDRARLTMTNKPGTPAAESATFVRGTWPPAGR